MLPVAAERKEIQNGDRAAERSRGRALLGREVSRVRSDGGTRSRKRKTGRSAGGDDLPQRAPLFGADRKPTALRVGRPISAPPRYHTSGGRRRKQQRPVSLAGELSSTGLARYRKNLRGRRQTADYGLRQKYDTRQNIAL